MVSIGPVSSRKMAAPMPKFYDEAAVRKMLQSRMKSRPLREVAAEIGISHSYLALILSGERQPAQPVLRYLGLTSRTVFVRE